MIFILLWYTTHCRGSRIKRRRRKKNVEIYSVAADGGTQPRNTDYGVNENVGVCVCVFVCLCAHARVYSSTCKWSEIFQHVLAAVLFTYLRVTQTPWFCGVPVLNALVSTVSYRSKTRTLGVLPLICTPQNHVSRTLKTALFSIIKEVRKYLQEARVVACRRPTAVFPRLAPAVFSAQRRRRCTQQKRSSSHVQFANMSVFPNSRRL